MSARDRILAKLRQQRPTAPPAKAVDAVPLPEWDKEERLQRFQRNLKAVRAEVHRVTRDGWIEQLGAILEHKAVRTLLAPVQHPLGRELRAGATGLPELLSYQRPIEEWQEQLFRRVDAALTSTRGGIAETGSLILWPDQDQPRLMSLVPPIHVAVVDAGCIFPTLAAAMTAQNWASGLPSNVILVSGPSKTADIEQTLAYGIHGPKQLVVLLRD